jgi:hypothetical protein
MSTKTIIAKNVFHFVLFVLLGILIGRESVKYEQPQFKELIESIRENPINIKIMPIMPIPVPIQPNTSPNSQGRIADRLTAELNTFK